MFALMLWRTLREMLRAGEEFGFDLDEPIPYELVT